MIPSQCRKGYRLGFWTLFLSLMVLMPSGTLGKQVIVTQNFCKALQRTEVLFLQKAQ